MAAPSLARSIFRVLGVIIGALALWLLATVPLPWNQQLVFGGLLLLFAGVVSQFSHKKSVLVMLSLLTVYSAVRYLYWRVTQTYDYLAVNWMEARAVDLFFVFILLGAELYAFTIAVLGLFQNIRPLHRPPIPLPDDTSLWPAIDFFIPTYNEPLDVVRTTVLAAMNVDWPAEKLNIVILDDGRRQQFREFAEECGVGYMIRPDNKHAKAGNINHALAQTNSKYIAIFDCDHIPTRSFLQLTVGWFLKDPRLGMLQTPHHFYSPDPFERNLGVFHRVPNEGALFYGAVQDGSDFWNATFFCGSCAVLRRTALEEIGGVAVETVTEDCHTSLRMQRRGWNTAYIRIPQAAGLATGSLGAHIGQRIRWARGMIQILRMDNPLWGKGLKATQRLCYLNCMLHFLYAAPRLIFLTSPLVYLLLGCSNIYGYGRAIVAYGIPYLGFAILTSSRLHGKYRHSFWNEIYEAVLAPYILFPTLVALISPRHGKFNVTSKRDTVDEAYFDWRLAAPYIVLLMLNLAGATTGIVRVVTQSLHSETLLINVFWAVMNILVLGVATAVAMETRQRRATVRFAVSLPVVLTDTNGSRIEGTTVDISRGGFRAEVEKPLSAHAGEKLRATFRCGRDEFTFPLVLIGRERNGARFSFADLSLQAEEQLVHLIFGRADSWVNWQASMKKDVPLLSFLRMIGIAFQGLSQIAVAFVNRFGKADSEPLPPTERALGTAASKNLVLVLCLLAGLGCANHLYAQKPPGPGTFNDSYDLPALGPKGPLLLRGGQAQANLYFGVPLTRVATEATLDLRYRASVEMAEKISVLNIELNGSGIASVQIAQLPDPESVISAEIKIPTDLLSSGNTLAFHLKARCVPGCNGKTPEDLWLRLEPQTTVHLQGTILTLASSLGLLLAPFFDRSSQRITVAKLAFLTELDDHILEAAGIIASTGGILADYRGVRFELTTASIPEGNVIVFALNKSTLMYSLGLSNASGPMLQIRDNPSDQYGKIVVISGDNSAEILKVAQALATGNFPRSGDSASLANFKLPPPRKPNDAPRWLKSDSSRGLGDDLNPDDLKVFGTGSVNLYFRLAPDLYFGTKPYIPLHLRYRLDNWPKGTIAHMSIRLNGNLVSWRKIPDNALDGTHAITMGLPVNALLPANTLNVEFTFDADHPFPPNGYPTETVLPSSTIDVSGLAHFVEMPRLDLFANAGYPFTEFADLSQTAVMLPLNPSLQQISLFLEVLGFLGARTGYAAIRLTVVHPDQPELIAGKNVLAIDPSKYQFEPSVFTNGPAFFANDSLRLRDSSAVWDRLPLGHRLTENQERESIVSADPKPEAYLSEFSSSAPFNASSEQHRTVLVIDSLTSPQTNGLEDLFAKEAGITKVYGTLSVLQGGLFHSFTTATRIYGSGNLHWAERCRLWIKRNYWALPILVVLVILIMSSRIAAWLEERALLRLEMKT